jgi:lysophospholipid acyltransferase (LPLAT)-like uncharacterized protein
MKTPSRWGRRVLHSAHLRHALCWLMHLYIRFIYATNRWTIEGTERLHRLRGEGRSFIVAFWHSRLLMMPAAWHRLAPMYVLISAHRDGRIIADTISFFGIESIPGSTKRGGSAALRAMLKRLEAGDCVGVTPDGPRGPAMTASGGIVTLARLSGVPIIPIVFATSRRRVLPTWDRFHLALPFGRGVYLCGEPIEIGRELDAAGLERARLLIEGRINDLTSEADSRVGHGAPMSGLLDSASKARGNRVP